MDVFQKLVLDVFIIIALQLSCKDMVSLKRASRGAWSLIKQWNREIVSAISSGRKYEDIPHPPTNYQILDLASEWLVGKPIIYCIGQFKLGYLYFVVTCPFKRSLCKLYSDNFGISVPLNVVLYESEHYVGDREDQQTIKKIPLTRATNETDIIYYCDTSSMGYIRLPFTFLQLSNLCVKDHAEMRFEEKFRRAFTLKNADFRSSKDETTWGFYNKTPTLVFRPCKYWIGWDVDTYDGFSMYWEILGAK
jgi:hypothetical protein